MERGREVSQMERHGTLRSEKNLLGEERVTGQGVRFLLATPLPQGFL